MITVYHTKIQWGIISIDDNSVGTIQKRVVVSSVIKLISSLLDRLSSVRIICYSVMQLLLFVNIVIVFKLFVDL